MFEGERLKRLNISSKIIGLAVSNYSWSNYVFKVMFCKFWNQTAAGCSAYWDGVRHFRPLVISAPVGVGTIVPSKRRHSVRWVSTAWGADTLDAVWLFEKNWIIFLNLKKPASNLASNPMDQPPHPGGADNAYFKGAEGTGVFPRIAQFSHTQFVI